MKQVTLLVQLSLEPGRTVRIGVRRTEGGGQRFFSDLEALTQYLHGLEADLTADSPAPPSGLR
ncbi:hypothetical protein [Deinococcus ruber]|uniref:Uncharacterized protein n=1 Tax=Deinococcus ruber TaxID=1848197 RepID=A0A918F4K6_9DEIO|nr:hypothetical protein [Deinococcus ruber]GGR03931.1 hypothetical protein GCM10008957_16110 [Deinococcus ruber]